MTSPPVDTHSGGAVLYRNGQVRSPVSPFATALLIQHDEIAWVGTEDAANDMAAAAGQVVDLADAWVAPGFVEAGIAMGAAGARLLPAGTRDAAGPALALRRILEEAGRLGVVELHELAGPGLDPPYELAGLLHVGNDMPGPIVVPYSSEPDAVGDQPGLRHVGLLARVDGLDGAAVAATLMEAAGIGRQVTFLAADDAQIDAVAAGFLAAAQQVEPARLVAGRHRLHGADRCPDAALAVLVRFGVAVVLRPLSAGEQRYAALAAAGLPLAMSSGGSFGAGSTGALDPWAALRAVTGLSARAAFTAATRGGHRAARRDGDGSGELAPGAPATFVVWALGGELVVEAPDDRVARWSTDPRAGVAGLPDLSQADPRALRTVIAGRVVYDTDELTVTTRR